MKKLLPFLLPFAIFISCTENVNKDAPKSDEPEKIIPGSKDNLFSFINTPTQAFTINNKKDTVLVGKKGTKILIPKNSLDADGVQPVEIKLKECYSFKDFLSENLTTTSNGKLIESNGMVHLSATSNGKEINLKKGKNITIGFPKNKQKKGFQTFYGNRDSSGAINWQPDFTYRKNKKPRAKKEADKKAFQIATYSFPDVYDMSLSFEKPELGDVQDYFSQNFKFSLSEAVPFPANESVSLQFRLNTTGQLVFQNADFYYNQPLKNKLTAFFKSFPNLVPYKNEKGVVVETSVYFNIAPNIALNEYLYSDSSNTKLSRKIVSQKQREEEIVELKRLEKEKEDLTKWEKADRENWEKRKTEAQLMDDAYTSLNATKLGWINCDRFYNDPAPKIEFTIDNEGTDFQLRLIFKDIKSMLSAYLRDNNHFKFANIPENKDVRIVAIKIENNNRFIGLVETNTSAKSCRIDFKKYSKEEAENLFAGL